MAGDQVDASGRGAGDVDRFALVGEAQRARRRRPLLGSPIAAPVTGEGRGYENHAGDAEPLAHLVGSQEQRRSPKTQNPALAGSEQPPLGDLVGYARELQYAWARTFPRPREILPSPVPEE
jgi:hypothetical protein